MFRYLGAFTLCLLAGNAMAAPIPYTVYEQARQGALANLECKWVATKTAERNRYQKSQDYDFLCTGGNWGTVTLMLDKSTPKGIKVQRIRLLWRAWDPQVHPSGGEAHVAQKYLHYVVNNFVPRKYAEEIQQTFWGNHPRKWVSQFTKINYTIESKQGHSVHRLEIVGNKDSVPTMANYAQHKTLPKLPSYVPVEATSSNSVSTEIFAKPIDTTADEPWLQPKPAVEYNARIKANKDGSVKVYGLSSGKRAVTGVTFPKQRVEPAEELRNKESLMRVKAPKATADDAYNKAWGLTNKYTKEMEEKGADLLNEEIKPSRSEIPAAKPLEEEFELKKYENEGQTL